MEDGEKTKNILETIFVKGSSKVEIKEINNQMDVSIPTIHRVLASTFDSVPEFVNSEIIYGRNYFYICLNDDSKVGILNSGNNHFAVLVCLNNGNCLYFDPIKFGIQYNNLCFYNSIEFLQIIKDSLDQEGKINVGKLASVLSNEGLVTVYSILENKIRENVYVLDNCSQIITCFESNENVFLSKEEKDYVYNTYNKSLDNLIKISPLLSIQNQVFNFDDTYSNKNENSDNDSGWSNEEEDKEEDKEEVSENKISSSVAENQDLKATDSKTVIDKAKSPTVENKDPKFTDLENKIDIAESFTTENPDLESNAFGIGIDDLPFLSGDIPNPKELSEYFNSNKQSDEKANLLDNIVGCSNTFSELNVDENELFY